MDLKLQKRLASDILKCSEKRVWLDPDSTTEIKEAITNQDIRDLINRGIIQEKPEAGVSRGRARYLLQQRRKGRRRGYGKRKGRKTARLSGKKQWMSRVRAQRKFLRELREKELIAPSVYRELYLKSKGGFFRNRRHIKLYLEENELVRK